MVSFLLALLLVQNASDLKAVLARAADYVAQYEADLGNLIGAEQYVQNSVWMDNSNPPRVARRMQRRTSADFLIIQVGADWQALRKVNRLDGLKVQEAAPQFEDAFEDSPQANARRLRDMKDESTQYNIGDVRRDINLPTFALKVLRKRESERFTFEPAGTGKVDGVETWRVRFREQTGPTLVTGLNGQQLYSHGMLWIEPETGRVLQTEFEVENTYASTHVTGRIVVVYGAVKGAQTLSPKSMTERYETLRNIIDCRADYSNFRPFEVDVKFEINEPQP